MKSKAAWIFFPCLANRPEWCLPPERLQVLAKVVALSEGLDMLQSLVRVSLERRFLDDPVRAFDHAVRPVVVRLGMPFLDAIELADALEAVTRCMCR